MHDLKLVRSDTPIFTLTFQALHVIDETSPIFGLTEEAMHAGSVRFIVTVTGHDGTLSTTIHARRIYGAHEVVWNARFADVLSNGPDGRLVLDYGKFHDVIDA